MDIFGQNRYKRIYICLYPSPIHFNVKKNKKRKVPFSQLSIIMLFFSRHRKLEIWRNGAKLK